MNFIKSILPRIFLTFGLIVKTFKAENLTQPATKLTIADKRNGTLFVLYPEKNLTVPIKSTNQTVSLSCDVDGDPKPFEVEWTKNEKPLETDDEYLSSNFSLELIQPYTSDNGKYKCRACNYHECINATILLKLIFHIDKDLMNNKTVIAGDTAVLNCSVIAHNHKAFRYVFVKQRVTSEAELLEYSSRRYSDKNLMIIHNVTLEHAGWYTCLVYGLTGEQKHAEPRPTLVTEFVDYKNAYLDVVLPENKPQKSSGAIIAGVTVLCIALALVSATVYRKMRQSSKIYERLIKIVTVRNQPNPNDYVGFQMPIISIQMRRTLTAAKTNHESAPVLDYEFPIDRDWEFPRKKLTLGDQLGAGAFGKVVMANAEGLLEEGVATPVAVKMLKDEHTDEEVKDLVCEMEIMKNIGRHPNIINLLGSCTQDGPLLVIVEYAALGNLKHFLQNHRFETSSGSSGEVKILTTKQLVTFASQIASGMQHLSSMKLIHRDLSARNILVSEGCIMKIADFGLARDVYNQEYYRKITTGKLPIRWMAPESLEERFFDTKSDVWSFGVLLWEIMTLGRDPYPFVADWQSFLEYLKQGKRLEQPVHCPKRIYHIMEACWEFESENRPTFDQISVLLEKNCSVRSFSVEVLASLNYANICSESSV